MRSRELFYNGSMKTEFNLELTDLLLFLKSNCHDSLKLVVSRIQEITEGQDELEKVREFSEKLYDHLLTEEHCLFPALESGESPLFSFDFIKREHEELIEGLIELRVETQNYRAHGKVLYELLKEMDRILLNHIQIEDNIILPMVVKVS